MTPKEHSKKMCAGNTHLHILNAWLDRNNLFQWNESIDDFLYNCTFQLFGHTKIKLRSVDPFPQQCFRSFCSFIILQTEKHVRCLACPGKFLLDARCGWT